MTKHIANFIFFQEKIAKFYGKNIMLCLPKELAKNLRARKDHCYSSFDKFANFCQIKRLKNSIKRESLIKNIFLAFFDDNNPNISCYGQQALYV